MLLLLRCCRLVTAPITLLLPCRCIVVLVCDVWFVMIRPLCVALSLCVCMCCVFVCLNVVIWFCMLLVIVLFGCCHIVLKYDAELLIQWLLHWCNIVGTVFLCCWHVIVTRSLSADHLIWFCGYVVCHVWHMVVISFLICWHVVFTLLSSNVCSDVTLLWCCLWYYDMLLSDCCDLVFACLLV